MAKNNRVCKVCNTEYFYCPTCTPREPSYKTMFCSEGCKNVWDVLSRHGVGKTDVKGAFSELNSLKIPKTLADGVKEHIKSIQTAVRSMEGVEDKHKEE